MVQPNIRKYLKFSQKNKGHKNNFQVRETDSNHEKNEGYKGVF